MNQENELVSLNVAGSISFASGFPRTFTQNSYALIDDFTKVWDKHSFQAGGSFTRVQDNIAIVGLGLEAARHRSGWW
jgi:hypothetical protein